MDGPLQLREATPEDLAWIHDLHHRVYAQDPVPQPAVPSPHPGDGPEGGNLSLNVYLVAARGPSRVGFISLTPPWAGRYALEKHVSRDELPLLADEDVFELGMLTVEPGWRGTSAALMLMYAALRWTASRGGRRVVAMGRTELLEKYIDAGLLPVQHTVACGELTFEVLTGSVRELTRTVAERYGLTVKRMKAATDWQLDIDFAPRPDGREHGSTSSSAVGTDSQNPHRRKRVVPADVLDAWFRPAPGVRAVLAEDPARAARTSPPPGADGLLAEIARTRALPARALAVGAGTSDLAVRAFGRWLTQDSRVLLLDPSCGEYAHVTEDLIGCRVDRLRLRRGEGWRLDAERLAAAVGSGLHDLVVVVNPNNPTGGHMPPGELRSVIAAAPERTRWWIDEAYLGYVGLGESLGGLAAVDPRVVVCASLAETYALSGLPAAYLVAEPETAAEMRRWTPPGLLSLPAQSAALAALRDPAYYEDCWNRTHALRHQLSRALAESEPSVRVEESVANFLTVTLPPDGPSAAQLVNECRRRDVHLRDLSPVSPQYEGRTVRVTVRDATGNARVVAVLREALQALRQAPGGGAAALDGVPANGHAP